MLNLKYFKKKLKQNIVYIALKFKRHKVSHAIFIFSEARGGSTWLMELLKNIPGVIINWEPLHVENGVVPKTYKLGWRPHLPSHNKDIKYKRLFKSIFEFQKYNKWTTQYIGLKDLKKTKYVLTKFVRANQILPWVVNTFSNLNHPPIFLLRHPIPTCISRLKTFDKREQKSITSLKIDGSFEIPECINNERFLLHKDYINNLITQLEVEIAIWCMNNANIINHKENYKWFTLYYEELVLYPEETFQAVLKGINIQLSKAIFNSINFRKASVSNFYGQLQSKPQEQLESFFKQLTKEELERIQDIFDYFELKVYSAFSAYPIN